MAATYTNDAYGRVGAAILDASLALDNRTNAAASVTLTKVAQTITYPQPADYANSVSATASSGLAVTYTSQTPLVCSVDPVTGAVTSELAPGDPEADCTIRASEAGNGSYDAAANVDRTFKVKVKADQTIDFPQPADGASSVSATATSTLAVTYTSQTTGVCSVNSVTGAITVVSTGVCTIAASQAGNDNYNPAPSVVRSFNVTAAPPPPEDPAPAPRPQLISVSPSGVAGEGAGGAAAGGACAGSQSSDGGSVAAAMPIDEAGLTLCAAFGGVGFTGSKNGSGLTNAVAEFQVLPAPETARRFEVSLVRPSSGGADGDSATPAIMEMLRVGPAVDLQAVGFSFDEVSFCLPYDPALLAAAGGSVDQLALIHVKDDGTIEEITTQVLPDQNLVCGVASSFSVFFVAVVSPVQEAVAEPEPVPETQVISAPAPAPADTGDGVVGSPGTLTDMLALLLGTLILLFGSWGVTAPRSRLGRRLAADKQDASVGSAG